MADYPKLLATVKRLIEKNGRVITLSRKDETPIDVNKPWRGSLPESDALALPAVTYETFGVFVPPNTVRQFGLTALGEGTEFKDLLAMTEQIIICPGLPVDDEIRQYTTVKDRGQDWGVLSYQVLRPGDIPVLSFILVRR
jgi:hypothetical protein